LLKAILPTAARLPFNQFRMGDLQKSIIKPICPMATVTLPTSYVKYDFENPRNEKLLSINNLRVTPHLS
jgi:hypothetical protein